MQQRDEQVAPAEAILARRREAEQDDNPQQREDDGEEDNGEAEEDDDSINREGEDEDNRFPQDLSLPVALPPDDPRRMLITAEERRIALALKRAVANNPDLVDNITDFMYAQCAIVDGDNLEKSMERLYSLQCFRQEYKIDDSAEQGVDLFRSCVKLIPHYHLSVTYHQSRGIYVMIYDNAGFFSRKVESSDETMRQWLGSSYYTELLINPDLEAVRRGSIVIVECSGYGMSDFFRYLLTTYSSIITCFDL